nr:right-handed parallel beta-helix repeat-containing protein [Candidatus Sigynarchaeota archaeon]
MALSYPAFLTIDTVTSMTVFNCTFQNSSLNAVQLYACNNVLISNSSFENDTTCIDISAGANITIANNSMNNCGDFCVLYGITLNFTLDHNNGTNTRSLVNLQFVVIGDSLFEYNILDGNTIDGIPFVFVKNEHDFTHAGPALQVIVLNSTNTKISNVHFVNVRTPAVIYKSVNTTLENVTIDNAYSAIYVERSNVSRFITCNVTGSNTPFSILNCTGIIFENSTISNFTNWISISNSNGFMLQNCTILNSSYIAFSFSNLNNSIIYNCSLNLLNLGIYGNYVTNLSISNSSFENDTTCVYISTGANITLANNSMNNCGDFCVLYGTILNFTLDHNKGTNTRSLIHMQSAAIGDYLFEYNILDGNTIDGIPFVFIKNKQDFTYAGPALQVVVLNSTNTRISGARISNVSTATMVYKCVNTTFDNVTIDKADDSAFWIEQSNVSRILNCNITVSNTPFLLSRSNDIVIDNSTISNFTSTSSITSCAFVKLLNCTIQQSAYNYALSISSLNHSIIQDCFFDTLYGGFYGSYATNLSIENNTFSSGVGEGVYISSTNLLNIRDNVFNMPCYTAVSLINITSLNCSDNIFGKAYRHISFSTCAGLVIKNNTFFNSSDYGLYGSYATNLSIENNTFSSGVGAGVYVYNANVLNVRDNVFNMSCYTAAILYNITSLNCSNNIFRNANQHASISRSNGLVIKNNTFFNSAYAALSLSTVNDTIVENCSFDGPFNNDYYGYSSSIDIYNYYSNAESKNVTIRDCAFSNGGNAIAVQSIDSCSVISNTFFNFTGYRGAIYFYEANNSVIANNNLTMVNSSSGAIWLTRSSRCNLSDNNIDGVEIGITLYSSSRNRIDRNNLTAFNYDGILLSESDRNNITSNTLTGNATIADTSNIIGLDIWSSKYNEFAGNVIDTTNASVSIYNADSNLFFQDTFKHAKHGMVFYQSKLNVVNACLIDSITVQGLRFRQSTKNNVTSCEFINVSTCVYEDGRSHSNLFWDNINCDYVGQGEQLPLSYYIGLYALIGLIFGLPLAIILSLVATRRNKIKTLEKYAATGKVQKDVILKLDNVVKDYKIGKETVHALRGISLEIERGEFVSLMGPSGSGKSTLLNIIAALDTPTAGNVILNGKSLYSPENRADDKAGIQVKALAISGTISPVARIPLSKKRIEKIHSLQRETELAKIRRLQIGIVFQHYNLIPVLTALENVMLPLSIQNISEEQKRKKALDLLEKVGLKGKEDRLPTKLSGGEQQRVSIARALANDPLIVLADEPTGNLDQKTGREIIKLFETLNTEHKQTFLIVTHDPAVASRAHRIIKIRDGLLES